jgi:homoserine dehydrogenase
MTRGLKREVRLGLLGWGTIGQGVIKTLRENSRDIESRLGARLVLAGVADPDLKSPRKIRPNKSILTRDPMHLIQDPGIQIIIELIGDHPGVKGLVLSALRNKKSVVTANKALIAKHGDEIFRVAERHGQDIYYEASVGGGIPIIRVMREGLAANRISSILGIVNGTCNYILTEMAAGRGDYPDILDQAQKLGYAEADPRADVEGIDSAHKLAILVRLGFGLPVKLKQIFRQGITSITPLDIEAAREFGYAIKLLAIAKLTDGGVEARVHPTLIPSRSLLASVDGPFNAIYVTGNMVGPTMYYGQGAGRDATASAVVADCMELARNISQADKEAREIHPRRLPSGAFISDQSSRLAFMNMSEIMSRYYLRLMVRDQPGVLSRIAGILARDKISISQVIQRGPRGGASVPIVIMTHEAKERSIQKAISGINRLKVVLKPVQMIRIETRL